MRFGDRSHNRQAEAAAVLRAGRVGAGETFPCAGEEVRGKAWAVIGDVQLDEWPGALCAEVDMRVGVTQRVGEQVVDGLSGAVAIDEDAETAPGRRS